VFLDLRISLRLELRFLSTKWRAHARALCPQSESRLVEESEFKGLDERETKAICVNVTSLTMASLSALPKAFLRSSVFATSPFETLMKTLFTWTTSSILVSLGITRSVSFTPHGWVCLHSVSPFLYLVLVACNLEGLGSVSVSYAVNIPQSAWPPS
jgi:hypothetical protein